MSHTHSTDSALLERVMKLYQPKHKVFGTRTEFAEWYHETLVKQNYCCFYCETPIQIIQQLIDAGLLRTRATRGEGYRGRYLEIDKQDDGYCTTTSVLACYYCNNDKSYIFSKEHYKQFFGSSKGAYFNHLAQQLNK